MRAARVIVPAEMTGRELARRPVALGLLTALPVAFYEASAHHSSHAAITGGLAMAFSIAGASIFAAMTARPVDRRLALAGYRPFELLLGRVLLLEVFGLIVAAGFSVLIVLGSGPSDDSALVTGVMLVAITSVPFGLAIGALAPHELEGVLILIGVVGIQLTLESTQLIAKLLPFWGAQRLIAHSVDTTVPTGAAIAVGLLYSAGLLAVAAFAVHRRASAHGVRLQPGHPA
ncbi:MAG: hypothetical protein ACRDLP_05545 [Solirubrobacteraceae bacterium]